MTDIYEIARELSPIANAKAALAAAQEARKRREQADLHLFDTKAGQTGPIQRILELPPYPTQPVKNGGNLLWRNHK